MRNFPSPTALVRFNDTDLAYFGPGGRSPAANTEALVKELTDLPDGIRLRMTNPQLEAANKAEIDIHIKFARDLAHRHLDGDFALPATWFTTVGERRFTVRAAQVIVEVHPLGASLMHRLSEAGLFAFVERIQRKENRSQVRGYILLLLASLCLSTTGARSLDDLSSELIKAWILRFRVEGVRRWNPDLWNSSRDAAYQALREIAHAFSRTFADPGLSILAAQKRSDSGTMRCWANIRTGLPRHLVPWLDAFERWRAASPAFAKTYRQMFQHLLRWLDEHQDKEELAVIARFMKKPRPGRPFVESLLSRGGGSTNPPKVMDYLSQAARFSEFIASELDDGEGTFRIHHLVTKIQIQKAKNTLKVAGKERASEAKSRPLPKQMYEMTRQILEEGEKGWPGQLSLCQERIIRPDGTEETRYCPVLPTLFLTLFHIPLRVGQAKRLDSGEGDLERFDGSTMVWSANRGPNAGHWASRSSTDVARGYAVPLGTTPPLTGYSINTNKTGKPYVIPYQNEVLHRLLHDLRCWQETFNPIGAPIGPAFYVDGVEDADEGKLEEYPDIFPLFRLPTDRRSGRRGCPPSARRTNEFWQFLMAELERRWNLELPHSEQVRIVKRNARTGQPYSARYNAHGLRVAGITMMLDRRVPIEIISKLVAGHRSILMTLHYWKLDPARIHEILSRAAQENEVAAMSRALEDMRSASLEEARNRTVYISDDGVIASVAMDDLGRMGWTDIGIGICPFERTRCGDGGPSVGDPSKRGSRTSVRHGPVEGGPGNCIMCRHFWTTPEWRVPLWLYGNELLRKLGARSGRLIEINAELEALHERKGRGEAAQSRDARLSRDRLQTEADRLGREREILGTSVWNLHRIFQSFLEIEQRERGEADSERKGLSIVVPEADALVSYTDGSEFVLTSLLTLGSRHYPMFRDESTEKARDEFVDRILWKSGREPISIAPMDPETKRRARDSFSALLLKRMRAEEIRAMEEGAKTLDDFVGIPEIAGMLGSMQAIGASQNAPRIVGSLA